MNDISMLSRAVTWVYGVIVQGERLLLRAEDFIEAVKDGDHNKFEIACERLELDEHFFCIAVNEANEWLIEVGKKIPGLKTYSKMFSAVVPLAKELRNMREHEIDYYKGCGKKQLNRKKGELGLENDAQSAMFTKGSFEIGKRINVEKTKEIAEKIYPILRERLSKLMDALTCNLTQ